MPIRFRCEHCRKRSSISSKMAGKSVSCPACGQPTRVVAEENLEAVKSVSVAKPVLAVEAAPAAVSESAFRPGATFDISDLEEDSPQPAQVAIRDAGGPMGARPLSKSEALTFGRHTSNDVVIDEDGVSTLHCRISWNGSGYEMTTAHKGGVEVNGTLVKSRVLCENDVIRIGTFDIAFVPEESAAGKSKAKASGGRQPPEAFDRANEIEPASKKKNAAAAETPAKGSAVRSQDEDIDPVDSVVDFLREDAKPKRSESRCDDESAGAPPASERAMAEVLDDDEGELEVNDMEVIDDVDEDEESSVRKARRENGESTGASKRARFQPTEENVLRSRIVLSLGGTGIVLVLASLVFWFLVNREKAQREFEAAKAEVDHGQFDPGIKRLEDFLANHHGHALTKGPTGARVLRDKTLVEKQIIGGSPNWAEGLKAYNEFVKEHRDEKYFEDLRQDLAETAKKIAMGAPKTASQNKDASLLELSVEAEKFFLRFSPPDAPPTEALREIGKARDDAKSTILKAGVVTKAFGEIDAALKAGSPFPVVATRQKLIVKYRDMEKDKKLEGGLKKALDLAKQQVTREELNRDALIDDPSREAPKPLTLAVRTRALSDEQSANRVVLALGQDGCFGVDSITGDPLWRRTVGLDTPFFPMLLETSRSAVLMFDTTQQQLLLLDRRTGELLWRQIVEPVAGPPLVVQGQIYLPTREGFLYRIDADSGRITSRLTFPQKLLAPPIEIVTEKERHLIVIGDAEFAYTLSVNPLECKVVSHLGHQPGTIAAAPLAMGQYVLLAENDRATTARLRAIDASSPTLRVADVAEARVEGHVRDELILRGNQLFVVSGGPRLSVFNVSDDKNQRTIAPVATLQIPTTFSGAAHLAAGADGQIWLSVGALRKVQLKTDVLQLDQQQVAVGQSTQPIQAIGRSLYIGRQLPISQAVHLTQADGESMQSNWRTVVGASLLAVTMGADGQLVCASNAADTFLVSANEVANGGFRARAEQQLKLPDNTVDPLHAAPLTDGRLAVWTGGADGKLWVIGPTALPQAEVPLPQTLDCAPIRFANGVLLPLPGRLKLAGRTGGPPCDDFLAPVNTADDAPSRKWKHLISIDDDQLFVIDNAGKVVKLQYRTGAKCFFQTISSLDSPQPIDVAPTLYKDRLMTADAAGTLRVLDVTAMETRASIELGGAASKPLWVAEPLLLAEVGRQKLVAFDIAQPKQPLWTLKLDGNGLVGAPVLIDGALIAVQQTGDVLKIDPKTGMVTSKLPLGQIATHGPIRLGNLLTVITADGSLHHVESLVPSLAQAAAESAKPRPPRASEAPAETKEEQPAAEDAPQSDKPKVDMPAAEGMPANNDKPSSKEEPKDDNDSDPPKKDASESPEKADSPKAE